MTPMTGTRSKCWTCNGWGWVLVEGGMPGQQVPDECPNCEAQWCMRVSCCAAGMPRHLKHEERKAA